ncbi:hypothetical protein ACF1A5_04345 [Streptomyces sp. NPDC014864]|uniref:hypothetical protein n=1 Tax=Streptomyces sp. NPDC014864 TaxID=3364924 RepID=UPI0036FB260B
MTAPRVRADDGLEPVREALLAEACEARAVAVARARTEARATLEAAGARADAILTRARAAGRRDGVAAAARELVHARQDAARARLAARREAYEEFRRQVADGVRTAAGDRDGLLDALTRRARDTLGADAVVRPGADGGIVAEAPGRRLDLTPAALAERALDRFGSRVQELWTP